MTEALAQSIRNISHPLQSEYDLNELVEMVGNAKVVMLGEASHGTKEYYLWRTELTKRLIQEKNFSFMAVEGDWPDCYEVNRYIKGYLNSGENAEYVLRVFRQWPSWMWANEEVRGLVEWLHKYNAALSDKNRMFGFYGLDVYSLWESMEAIISYLKRTNSKALETAYRAYGCFEPYDKNAYNYGYATAFVDISCQKEVMELLSNLRTSVKKYEDDEETVFNAEQNARVALNAERYYRVMVRMDYLSWNIRDHHMKDTLERLLEYHGPHTKAVVWAHNTHIGDARATPMAKERMVNIGQLARDKFGAQNVRLVGFGSYQGSVIAGQTWDAPMQKMPVPKAQIGSWEHIFHEVEASDKLIFTRDLKNTKEAHEKHGHRAIGVVYDPKHESRNYVPTDLVHRYDAFLYLDQTQALEPLPVGRIKMEEIPETFPTGE